MPVLGVDACGEGWIAVRLERSGPPTAICDSSIESVVVRAQPVDVVAIDIPIGIPRSSPRQADVLARGSVGAMGSSVFPTPLRAVLDAGSYADANALSRKLSGKGISKQSYALREKILEVERWVRPADVRVVEVHPEVSFAALKGSPLESGKKTWAGVQERLELLRGADLHLSGRLGLDGRKVAVDDVLDAAVAAWTARRVNTGAAVCLPDPPEVVAHGVAAAIYA